MTGKKYRIAQIGTFDLKNYGDILFPDVLSTELSKYLSIDEIVLFSPLGGMKPFDTYFNFFGVDMELLGYNCDVSFEEYRGLYYNAYGNWAAKNVVELCRDFGDRKCRGVL